MASKQDHGPGCACAQMEDALDRHTEAHWYLHQLNEHYHEADPFRYSLNSFLRSLKEVPQILQMQLQNKKGFKEFFAPLRSSLQQDPLFGSLSKKRDLIVHQGMLMPESKVYVGFSKGPGRGLKLGINFPASPSEDSDAVMARFVAFCVEHPDAVFIFLPDPDQLACVRRIWKLSDIPDVEIRQLAAQAWKRVGELLCETLVWLGHDAVNFDFPCMQQHLSEDTMIRLYPREIFAEVKMPDEYQ
jgi:hypothetical protein